ncbi:hypothetical protein [Marinimicrobium sp. ABcell2]|uniref:hypothetical protein n=1 Tax=Marinimicrobium sp. ABcell2 TaxID=3069751 RepID=UPI0027B07562|nr:hypothetical protein [Marinimicrobium sp. ABcell2]MDQ2076647.1 hypothetical protein [Marinimicrobium sp. ABcell2]
MTVNVNIKGRLMHSFHTSIAVVASVLLSFCLAAAVNAEEAGEAPPAAERRGPVIELESRVTGNREQPQVFYLVPWQSPEGPELQYDPLTSQLQQVFGHLEREELRRQLDQPAVEDKQSANP